MTGQKDAERFSRRLLLQAGASVGLGMSTLGTLSLNGCTPQVKSALGGVRFVFIVKTVNSDYWQTCLAGGRLAAEQLGLQALQFTGANSEANIQRQIEMVEDALAKRPDFIVLAPTSATALDATIETVYNSGVKVILIDSAANTDAYDTFLATDNHAGGVLAATTLAEAIKKKTGAAIGQVGYSTFLSGVGSLSQRDRGFVQGLKAYPGLEIVAHKDAGGDQSVKPIGIVADTLTRFPKLVGYFADSLVTLLGAVTAFRENRVDSSKVSLVGFDPTPQLVLLLKGRKIDGIILQDNFQMGYGGVAYGVLAAAGLLTPKFINTGVTAATPNNVDSPDIQGLLNPVTQHRVGLHAMSSRNS
jgi:ribose transport system substrate-binding protein